jgi:hypothetical protein
MKSVQAYFQGAISARYEDLSVYKVDATGVIYVMFEIGKVAQCNTS